MTKLILTGRKVVKGVAEGIALVTTEPLSFMGSINPKTGIIIERGHELEGECMKGRILVFPFSKGSTGGSYMLYDVVRNGVGPAGIINQEAESVAVIGAIVAELPMIDQVSINKLKTGDYIVMNADEGKIEVIKNSERILSETKN